MTLYLLVFSVRYAFSKNGLPTIEAKSYPNRNFGNARQMSTNDIERVNKLYGCSKYEKHPVFLFFFYERPFFQIKNGFRSTQIRHLDGGIAVLQMHNDEIHHFKAASKAEENI